MVVGEPVNYDLLEEYLRALAYSSRLELLSILRQPRLLSDIRLAPRQVRPGENPDRAISRQSIQAHLEKLMEIGVVVSRDPKAGGRRGKEFTVNPQRVYQILEELRKVGTVASNAPTPREDTVDLGAARPGKVEPGAKLMLVHGLVEGKVFPLQHAELKNGRGWVLGRKPGLHVSLEYDPYVSLENSEIVHEGSEYALVDLRSSKNGTWLNWERLGTGARVPLESGDLLGVGRSLLVFRER